MSGYKNIAIAYLNDSKSGVGKYLSIANTSDEDIVIKAGEKFFMNMTPKEIREANPKVPLFSKSVKIEDHQPTQQEDVSDDIPFS